MISRAETFINRSKHEKTLTITLLFICQPTWVLLMYVYIDSVFIFVDVATGKGRDVSFTTEKFGN